MSFERVWDESCPRVYDQWESDGVSYVIKDLPPEDDEVALKLLVEDFLPDEPLCSTSGVADDPPSLHNITLVWRSYLLKRMSLACYATKDGKRTLAAFNVCAVQCQGQEDKAPQNGKPWMNVYNVVKYFDERLDTFEYLGLDKIFYAVGLVVRREYRGAGLGARVLACREPLCRHLGIKGTSTMFTGPGSQKSAERAGFTTVYEATFRELADAGMEYPQDDRVVKLMVKKYD